MWSAGASWPDLGVTSLCHGTAVSAPCGWRRQKSFPEMPRDRDTATANQLPQQIFTECLLCARHNSGAPEESQEVLGHPFSHEVYISSSNKQTSVCKMSIQTLDTKNWKKLYPLKILIHYQKISKVLSKTLPLPPKNLHIQFHWQILAKI